MANMFVPGELDTLVKREAEDMRREMDDVDYIPEWQALVALLTEDAREEFLEMHGDELSAIDAIADSTGESIQNPDR